MMRTWYKRPLAMLVSVITALSTVPTSALAAPAYDVESAIYNEDGTLKQATFGPYTLLDRQVAHPDLPDENDQVAWIDGEAKLTYENLQGIADKLSKDWAPIAGAIYNVYSDTTIDSRNDDYTFDEWYGPSVTNGDDPEPGSVDVTDALRGRLERNTKDESDTGGDRYNMDATWHKNRDTYMTSGLQMANSMDDILREMCNMSIKATRRDGDEYTTSHQEDVDTLYKKASGSEEDNKPPLAWMSSNQDVETDSSTKAFYRLVTSAIRKDDKDFANTYGLIFYDFELAPITADGVTVPNVDYSSTPTDGGTFTTYFENRSQADSDVGIALNSSTTETVSNSFSKDTTITHGVEVGFEQKNAWQINVAFKWETELTIHGNYNWSKAVNTSHSSTEERSTTLESGSNSTVTLPAQTAIALEQRNGMMGQTITYKCPVVLNYKVAIVSLGCKPRSDIDDIKSFSVRFGSGSSEGGVYAPQNLYMRAINETTKNKYETPYGSVFGYDTYNNIAIRGINWNSVLATYNDEYQTAYHARRAATTIPLLTEGATMTVDTKSKVTELGSIQPIYPLNKVKLEKGDPEYSLAVGDTMSLDGLEVGGYNDNNVAYFGFDPDAGSWVLSDAEGNELATSDVAALSTNPATGAMTVEATGAGDVYLKWVLADDVSYKAKEGAEVKRGANEPRQTAMVHLTVSEPPFDATGYAVKAEGAADTIVNVPLNLFNAFDAGLYDPYDILKSRAVTWQAQDQSDTSPVTIDEAGNFLATAPGTYRVRATYLLEGTFLHSDWVSVPVTPAPAVQGVTIDPEELTAAGGQATVTLAGSSLRDGAQVTLTDEASDARMVATTEGDATSQVATFTIPANTVFGTDTTYQVEYAACEGDEPVKAGTICVKANTLSKVEAVEPSCTEAGCAEHYVCNETGKLYDNATGSHEVTPQDLVVEPTAHALRQVEETAHCEQEGNAAYWICDTCGSTFADEGATQPVSLDDVTIPATGHLWGQWVKDAATGTETRTCANDPTHIEMRGNEEGAPVLKSHSLTLSGTIGVNNFMDLSSLADDEIEGSYMEFEVGTGDKQVTYRADFDPTFQDENGKGYYGFACPTTSVQMADPIHTTFHYAGKSIDFGNYSVKQYVEQYEGIEDTRTASEVALVHAIADYGHYAQPFLAAENGWTVGDDYATMDKCYTNSFDQAEIKNALAAYAPKTGFTGTKVGSGSVYLRLDTGTTVGVMLSPAEGQSLSAADVRATFTADKVPDVELLEDGRLSIRVDDVSAHELATPIVVTCNGKEILRTSALSYAHIALNEASGIGADGQNTVCGLYRYFDAARTYLA